MADIDPTQAYQELNSEEEVDLVVGDDKPISANSVDWTVNTLRDKYDRGKIILQPEYQREYVWRLKPELPSRLIESLLLNIPIPPIYFAELPSGQLEVIDGQQRLTTIFMFLKSEFALQKLERLQSLNGKKYNQLTDAHQEKIIDTSLRSISIAASTNDALRYEVFERLNRGTMPLNNQEIRNCVYRGLFCDLLAKLEKDATWRGVKGTPLPEARFVEREMILRFFAFTHNIDQYRGNLKRFLNDYMSACTKLDDVQVQRREVLFQEAMKNVYTVFGPHSGRLYNVNNDTAIVNGKWDTAFSISALDIQAGALVGQSNAKVQAAAEQIREAYLLYFLSSTKVRDATTRYTAVTEATKTRWQGFKAQVQNILNGTQVEPRFFTFEFRKQLFEQNATCELCGSQIHHLDDCAVDHIKPYSKGGKTEPQNAQLAHRICNSRKCANEDYSNVY